MPLSTGRERQNHIYTAGVAGRTPTVPTDFPGLERRALTKMSDRARAYIAGGAGSGTTMDNNRRALDRWNIVPRVLRDVSARTTESELLGLTLPAPVLFAPVGAGGAVHRQADLLIGQAAATLGLPYIFSNQGSVAMEEVAAGMDRIAPGSPRWFQLYWSTDDDLVDSLLTRAERSGASAGRAAQGGCCRCPRLHRHPRAKRTRGTAVASRHCCRPPHHATARSDLTFQRCSGCVEGEHQLAQRA